MVSTGTSACNRSARQWVQAHPVGTTRVAGHSVVAHRGGLIDMAWWNTSRGSQRALTCWSLG
jgi:hypothetical protein